MQTKNKERFFVTGGMGYIGAAFAKEALDRGHDVCIFDSLLYEQNRNRMLAEISSHQSPESEFKFIIGDTRNTELLRNSISLFEPTYVMHWGDLSSVYSCNHNPIFTEDICYTATCSLVDICAELGIKLLFNSTSSVYGVQTVNRLMTETDPVPEPTDYYCRFKLQVEDYIKAKIANNSAFKVIVFRPATVFGVAPRFRIELLPNHFTYCGVAHGVVYVADLNAYRAAIDIEDLVAGYFKVIEAGEWKHLIYNIGQHNFTKIEYALGVQRVTGCQIKTFEDFGNLRNLQIDCELFESEFGFKPQYSYEDSVRRVSQWLTANLSSIKERNFAEMLNMPLADWLKISS